MLRRRPGTRWLCAWLAQVLLFAQLATAAYACPAWRSAATEAAGAVAPAQGPCEHPAAPDGPAWSMDPDLPQLCRAHCQADAQKHTDAPATDVTRVPVLLLVLDWPALTAAATAAVVHPAWADGAAPPGGPPLYLTLQVLRN